MTKEPVFDRIRRALEDLPNRVTIGFEVETQMTEEKGEPDRDAMRQHAEEHIDTGNVCNSAGVSYSSRWIDALGQTDDPEGLAGILNLDWDTLVDEYVDGMDESDWCSAGPSWDDVGSDISRMLNRAQSGWEYCEDGSVSGPEFQSPICKGRAAAIRHAEALLGTIEDSCSLRIDTECSCHIHLKMENVYHKGHNVIQQLIFEELFNRLDELPSVIKERCAADLRWIRPTASGSDTANTKYNPIQRHTYGTWEFRLFGGIQTVEEFTQCLDAALAAMRRAYTRFIDGERREIPADTWTVLARRSMVNWHPIQDCPEYAKYWAEPSVEIPDQSTMIASPITGLTNLGNGSSVTVDNTYSSTSYCQCSECRRDRELAAVVYPADAL